ncbi:MAG: hypothetical protein ACREVQ_00135 [Burkholderiales bacterium]
MKELIARYVARIDAATLRERAMIFAAAALLMIVMLNSALLAPLRARQQRLAADIERTETELRTIQAELQRVARERQVDPDAQNRARVQALRADIARLDATIVNDQRQFTPPDRMRTVLEEMLERNKRLHLLDLKTLPVADLTPAQSGEARRVFRHGLELTVSGSYLDLHAYLRALESAPTQLHWGKSEMSVSEYPVVTLKLIVYTLSFDQAWLVV